ncbi:MAG: translation elongation factor-like protein [Candidatus Omnitrophica bacterium]|nr:translation elongation factor-like protein [Candidatus Omnitrophota bacterium]
MPIKKKKVKKAVKKRRIAKLKKKITKPVKVKVQVPKEELVGIITHYFPHVKAGVLKLKVPLAIGDTIKIKGHTTDFTQTVTSMQINHVPITKAKKGDEIGLLVESRVRRKDKVFKVKS